MFRSKLLAAAALFVLAAVPVDAVAQGGGPEPVIGAASVSPSSLSYLGGDVVVQAEVTDDVGVTDVWVDVILNGHNEGQVAMSFAEGSRYEAVVTLAQNLGPDPASYSFTVSARDLDNSQVSREAGEVEVAGQPPFDELPNVSSASVQPSSLPAGGGPVTIRATATDTRGISEVYATVTSPSGGTTNVPLEPVSFSDFEGTYTVPPNWLASAVQHTVRVTALDDATQEASADAGAVTVAARRGKASRLRATPGRLDLGTVRTGRTKQKTVAIKHEGDRRAAPLPLTLHVSGAPFAIFAERLVLAPGKTVHVLVEYAPTTPGRHTGALTIDRGDGGPSLVVPLRGKGR